MAWELAEMPLESEKQWDITDEGQLLAGNCP
jgi:hypothetical protein